MKAAKNGLEKAEQSEAKQKNPPARRWKGAEHQVCIPEGRRYLASSAARKEGRGAPLRGWGQQLA